MALLPLEQLVEADSLLQDRHEVATLERDERMLPGSSPSSQFIGWTFADADGKSVAGAARDLIVQLCEYTLHLDDFERVLAEEAR